ncbi:DNA mismatch endonuclease Vsr [Affinibrenneria salicis]|uniref:Very short patch repair endonuclease n=1 Tax=Affinibrenneria salicis TaxID=2590031 RepID=A0A5J5FS22_9GAMM|nr:DNA mismatch endonuclease Vsr [Affinibrenneria salicis]KAA8996169.1 DNA mismatch endonuclease Vsr [Affinibrenneria salicis]
MADVHNPATRSKNMRAIRNSDTAIEKRLAAVFDQLGLTYRMQVGELCGKPDFVLDDYRAIVFSHGCFWHYHRCYLFKVPATRTEFWLNKIGANVRRDREVMRTLAQQGWKVLIVWECALRGRLKLDDNALSERIEEWLCASDGHAQIDTQGIHPFALPADDAD